MRCPRARCAPQSLLPSSNATAVPQFPISSFIGADHVFGLLRLWAVALTLLPLPVVRRPHNPSLSRKGGLAPPCHQIFPLVRRSESWGMPPRKTDQPKMLIQVQMCDHVDVSWYNQGRCSWCSREGGLCRTAKPDERSRKDAALVPGPHPR
jgi:hypothetical protein